MTPDEQCLIDEFRKIKRHGAGKIAIGVGNFSSDKIKIQIEAGKIYTFILQKSDGDEED